MRRKVAILSLITLTVLASSTILLAAAEQTESASGKITAVSSNSFSIETAEGEALEFALNADTKIEGELTEGANAQVAYRAEDGKNVAVHVKVQG